MKAPDYSNEQWRNVEESFHCALKLLGAERDRFLEDLGSAQPFVAEEVRHLLGHVDDDLMAVDTRPSVYSSGDTIDRYLIESRIDEGGMGVVYRARQPHTNRPVALKILRPDCLLPEMLRRFAREAEILGHLTHEGIARVFEAAPADIENGWPAFIAMELVEGSDLLTYSKDLSIRDKLKLLATVSRIVFFAHQRGVIHRDLKPKNILIAENGMPKILDFGLGKPINASVESSSTSTPDNDAAFHPEATSAGTLVGTLAYMAPEQLDENSQVAHVQSDVYSLGVISFQLLSGELPYALDGLELKEQIRRRITEKPKSLANLIPALRGDVAAIVHKALATDLSLRYATAADFEADIIRFLNDEPVSAHRGSPGMRFRKLVRRNRGVAVASTLVLSVLVLGMIGTTTGYYQERSQRRLAEQRQKQTLEVAQFQSGLLENIDIVQVGEKLWSDFRRLHQESLEKMGVSEDERRARSETLNRELNQFNPTDVSALVIDNAILNPARATLDSKFATQPLVQATLLSELGECYFNLGLAETAYPLLSRAVSENRRLLGDRATETLTVISKLGCLEYQMGNSEASEKLLREALEARIASVGLDHEDTLELKHDLAIILMHTNRDEEAELMSRDTYERRKRVLGPTHPETMNTLNNIASSQWNRAQYAEAERNFREIYDALVQSLGPEHPNTVGALSNVAEGVQAQARFDEAESLYLELLEKGKRLYGTEHPKTLAYLCNFASMLFSAGQWGRAESELKSVIEAETRVLGERHPNTVHATSNYAFVLLSLKKLDAAEPLLGRVLVERQRTLGDDHAATLLAAINYTYLHQGRGDFAAAETELRLIRDKSEKRFGGSHFNTLLATDRLAHALSGQRKFDEAERRIRHAYEGLRTLLGPTHPQTLESMNGLSEVLRGMDRFEEASRVANEVCELRLKRLGRAHPQTRDSFLVAEDCHTAWHLSAPQNRHDQDAQRWRTNIAALDSKDDKITLDGVRVESNTKGPPTSQP